MATEYWRRNLIAISFASEPPDDRCTRSKPGPASRATRSVSASFASWRVLRTKLKVSCRPWSNMACSTRSLPWPRFVRNVPEAASMYRVPSSSHR